MAEVRLSRQAERAYRRLPVEVRSRIDGVLARLECGELNHPNVRALRGPLEGSQRWRVGDWRVVFRIDPNRDVVWVEAITTRGGAYR